MIYYVETKNRTYSYQTGDVFKKEGQKYLHIRNRETIGSHSLRTFQQCFWDATLMEVIGEFPKTYQVGGEVEEKKDYVITYNYAIQEHLECEGKKIITYKPCDKSLAIKHFDKLQLNPTIYKNLSTNFNHGQ